MALFKKVAQQVIRNPVVQQRFQKPDDSGMVPGPTGPPKKPPTVPTPGAEARPPQPTAVTGVSPGPSPAPRADDRLTFQGIGADTPAGTPVAGPTSRLPGIIAKSGALGRLAATKGRQFAHSRGLLNTSLAAQAAHRATLDYAVPLAEEDTRTGLYNREIAAQNRRHEMTLREQAEGRESTARTQRQAQIDQAVANAQNSFASEINSIRLSTSLSEKGKINAQQDARRRLDAQIRLIESSHDIDLDWSFMVGSAGNDNTGTGGGGGTTGAGTPGGGAPATGGPTRSVVGGAGHDYIRRRNERLRREGGAGGPGNPGTSSEGAGGGGPQGSGAGEGSGAGVGPGPDPGAPGGGGPGGAGGGCHLTTAIVERRGEADDGPTLTKLRALRDGFMQQTEERRQLIVDYERIAPRIVAAIPADHPDWDWIGEQVDQAIEFIDEGAPQSAMDIYRYMTHMLIVWWLADEGA